MKKLLPFLFNAALLFACVLVLVTCRKEYSYEGGIITGTSSGTAVYSLSGAGASCTGAVVNGSYITGLSLAASNTIVLQVNVTTPGTYMLQTATINGIQFGASGTFTTAGPQIIMLSGSGVPSAEGSFTFSPPVGQGCTFVIPVTRPVIVPAVFSLAGAPGDCQNFLVNGPYTSGTTLDVSNTVDISVSVTTPGPYTITTDTVNGIYFSASGTFTGAGNQTITLAGSGRPQAPGIFALTPRSPGSKCSFNVTVVDFGPAATYVLESGSGNPSPCVCTVSGNYQVNTALLASNMVRLTVSVIATGNFTIATPRVNGISFSLTGTFTNLGSQSVFLPGSGIPQVAGNYTLIPQIVGPHPLGGNACAVALTVN